MIGIDIVDINKFSNKKMIKNIFTDNEFVYANNKVNSNVTLAGIFAAKEAALKAYNLNIADILRKNIEIRHEENIPVLYIKSFKAKANISISHDGDYAVAICNRDTVADYSIDQNMARLLDKRDSNSHKGDYGKIAILGGSKGMAGSVYMASLACMRTGAGLSYILAPKSISNILQIKANEQIIREIDCDNFFYREEIKNQILSEISDKDVLAIGPGMARGEDLNRLIDEIIKASDIDIVIDADGLNAVSQNPSILKACNNIILTPHMGEFSRLTGISIDEINKDKVNIAKAFAAKYDIILVLKSHETLVTSGDELYINKIGNPGMATAGSGDVLTGVISTLMKRLRPFDAARLGVYIHSLAGDLASLEIGEDSLIATDIINFIPEAIKLLRQI